MWKRIDRVLWTLGDYAMLTLMLPVLIAAFVVDHFTDDGQLRKDQDAYLRLRKYLDEERKRLERDLCNQERDVG